LEGRIKFSGVKEKARKEEGRMVLRRNPAAMYSILKERRRKRMLRKGYRVRIRMIGKERRYRKAKVKAKRKKGIFEKRKIGIRK